MTFSPVPYIWNPELTLSRPPFAAVLSISDLVNMTTAVSGALVVAAFWAHQALFELRKATFAADEVQSGVSVDTFPSNPWPPNVQAHDSDASHRWPPPS